MTTCLKRISPFIIVLSGLIFLSGRQPQNGKKYAITKVVIDAGHGGDDPGCLGSFAKEKDVALAVALKLGKFIEENLKDVKVIYTRKTDVFVELRQRAAIANNNKADVFICIHCNSGVKKDANGAETYVMGLHRTDENLAVSKRENAAILLEEDYKNKYEGFDPNSPEANIVFSLYQNAFLEQSLNLASKIENHFKESAGRPVRGVKQAGFLVLWKTTMPSMLIETGFLTHHEEEKYLASNSGQQEIAWSIFKAFKEYKYEMETGKPMKPDYTKLQGGVGEEKSEITEDKETAQPVAEKHDTAVKKKADSLATPSQNSADVVQMKTSGNDTAIAANKDSTQQEQFLPSTVIKDTVRIAKEETVPGSKGSDKPPVLTESGIFFKVQFATSMTPLRLEEEKYKKTGGPFSTDKTPEGLLKYMVGGTPDFQEALRLQKDVREKGFSDAFVVAYKDGKRIPVQDALQIVKKK